MRGSYSARFIHTGSDHGIPTQHVRLTSYCTRNNFPYRNGHHRECNGNHHFFKGMPRDEWSKLRWNFGATNAFRSHLVNFNLSHTQWNGSDFTEAVLSGSNFAHAKLRDITFNRARMRNVNLHKADARNSDFMSTDIRIRDGRWAQLQDTTWIGAKIKNQKGNTGGFAGANFTGADFRGAEVDQNINFSGAIFTDVICPNGTNSNGRVCDWGNM